MRSLLPSKPQSCSEWRLHLAFVSTLSPFPAVLGSDSVGNLAGSLASSLMGHPRADLE